MQIEPTTSSPRRRLRLRFSLLTLLCFVLLAGSAMWLWQQWRPWVFERELKGHTNTISHAGFSHDGKLAVTSSTDGTVRVWIAATAEPIRTLTINRGLYSEVWQHSEFSPDDKTILSVSGYSAFLWPVETTNGDSSMTLVPIRRSLMSGTFSPDGQHVMTAGQIMQLWDAKDGRAVNFMNGSWFLDVNYSFDGTKIVAPSLDGNAYIFDSDTGIQLLKMELEPDRAEVFRASFSADGTKVVTSDRTVDNWHVRVWDVATSTARFDLRTPDPTVLITGKFSPDGRHILTAGGNGRLRIWNAESGVPIYAWKFSDMQAYCAAYSPDGLRIIACGQENIARIYRRNRPEEWWGLAWLPAFWTTLFFAGFLLWSLVRDRRRI